MPAAFQISEDDISYAQVKLLPEGEMFDDERKQFIANLETIDLQAVPGSGKTTALLAKLVILERYLPLNDGSGILVLSHTNAAVDEIRDKIFSYCPKLFSYPNFVGTIQSFVDQFLAIPYGNIFLGSKFDRIDSDLFREMLNRKFEIIKWEKEYGELGKWFWGKCFRNALDEANQDQQVAKKICPLFIEEAVKKIYYDFESEIIKTSISGKTLIKDKTNVKYIGLKKIIFDTLEDGYVSYEYAYSIANHFIAKIPAIKDLLQKRFNLVFVDEMQDMNKAQHDLLENIFYDNARSKSSYQRIGDKNQAIYDGGMELDGIWTDRDQVLRLEGSYRLSPLLGDVVKAFGLSTMQIEGRRKLSNPIKPHILVYDDNSQKNVISNFSKILKGLEVDGFIPTSDKNKYQAIAWVKSNSSKKISLVDYYPQFKPSVKDRKNDYETIAEFFQIDPMDISFRKIKESIQNVFIKVLRLEKIRDEKGKYFTRNNFAKNFDSKDLEVLNLKIYKWCIAFFEQNEAEVLQGIANYLPIFLQCYGCSIVRSSLFVRSGSPVSQGTSVETPTALPSNTYIEDGIEILISSVHSVKGQTHTATLYLETSFHENYGVGFESQRLSEQFYGKDFSSNKEFHKQSTKMAYVGFSRPTHLLAFAVHKERFDKHLNQIDHDVWEVITIENDEIPIPIAP